MSLNESPQPALASAGATAFTPRGRRLGHLEFVGLIAAMLAINAAAVDSMIPTLESIGSAFGVVNDNHQQYVIIAYMFGFAVAQPIYGPISDRYGRRPVLFAALALYSAMAVACVVSTTFMQVVVFRMLQGMGAAGSRTIAGSVVRDVARGSEMAGVLSQATAILIMVPILAPNLGQAIVLMADWRWVVVGLCLFGAAVAAWMAYRLGETLPEERRRPLHVRSVGRAYRHVLSLRSTQGYVLATGLVFGSLFAFLSSAQQVFTVTYERGNTFTLWISAITLGLVVSAVLNAKWVGRVGMRRISHIALVGFSVCNLVHLLISWTGGLSFPLFIVFIASSFFFLGMIGTNFFSIAMDPLGDVAGTGSAAFSSLSTLIAALYGGWIGQLFDGTALPLAAGLAAAGLIGLVSVTYAERGRLFVD